MEIPPLTEWEKRERDGLLALETAEWREKRLIAEDPNTTANALAGLVDHLKARLEEHRDQLAQQNRPLNNDDPTMSGLALLGEALAAHPNISPKTLLHLFWTTAGYDYRFPTLYDRQFPDLWAWFAGCAKGACRNPVVPFLILEQPDFWLNVNRNTCLLLLREETLPHSAATLLAQHREKGVAEAARTHISVISGLQTPFEGRAALTRFWQTLRAEEKTIRSVGTWKQKIQWVRERWAKVKIHDKVSRRVVFDMEMEEFLGFNSPYVRFAAHLHGGFRKIPYLYGGGLSNDWMERLNGAFGLPLSTTPFPRDVWNRSPLDLMNHLTRDGNRFVRWAAQTRLADPDFVFTWQDDQ